MNKIYELKILSLLMVILKNLNILLHTIGFLKHLEIVCARNLII